MEHRSRLSLYRATVVLVALLLLVGMLTGAADRTGCSWGLPLVLLLAVIAEGWPLRLPRYGPVSLVDPLCYASAVLYGPLATVVTAMVGGLSRFRRERARRRPSGEFVAYSLAQTSLGYGLGACLYAEYATAPLSSARSLLALAAAVLATFLVQASLVAVHQWMDQDRIGRWSSRINWSRLRLSFQAMAPLGVLLAETIQSSPLAVVLLLGPMVVTYLSILRYTETLREARDVIECLAEAVEKREPHTLGHAERVSRCAARIARQMGIDEKAVSRVETAGRLHDLGKISVDDSILQKRGALEEADLEKIRRHPEVGAQVAARLSLSREEAEYIRYHHEWFNGGGYPHGLKGDAIPLGARILAVAEAFDTLVTAQAYREPVAEETAMRTLSAAVGSQFDPVVVEALSLTLRRRAAGAGRP
ncbi:MAG: HD domain-containing protein [Armatimonadetes bacterium]|nr:HD domain-containing protein [Armatimonadota bacterium]